MTLSKQTIGYGIAAIVAILGNTALMWVKESNPAVLAWMKGALYHHWIAHGVFVVGAFVILGFVLSRVASPRPAKSLVFWLVLATALSAAGIVGFYLVIG
jgi:hypothetical protein